MFLRNLRFDNIEDTDQPPVNRIKNLLDDPWNPDRGATNPGRKQMAGSRISTEARFRRAAKTVLDRRRREEEALGFVPSRKPTPQLIGTATPATPPQKPVTPWWQSGRFEDIGGAAHSENSRQVDAILKSSDTGDLPFFIADALDTGANKALAEVSNLFKQLNDRAPERAAGLANEVSDKISLDTRGKLEGLERTNVAQKSPREQKPIEAPIAGLSETEKPEPTRAPPATPSSTLAELGEEANKIAKGVLGPAYDQAAALLKFAEELSPLADIDDALAGSREISEGVKNADLEKVTEGTMLLGAAMMGIVIPGSTRSYRKVVSTAQQKLSDALKNKEFENISFGNLSKPHFKEVNKLRQKNGVEPLTDRELIIPANVARKLFDKRIVQEGMSADELVDMLNSVFHGKKSKVLGSRFDHIQSLTNTRGKTSSIGFIGKNPKNGETVIKSGYKTTTNNIPNKIRKNPPEQKR